MIRLEDCIGLCGLTEEGVLAIAEHEHLPEIAATAPRSGPGIRCRRHAPTTSHGHPWQAHSAAQTSPIHCAIWL